MKVTLVSKTASVIEGIDTLGELIAYTARVSNPTNQMNTKTAPKLLQYLMKHGHWSPFEMCNMCVEINTTRDISRQILRHRSFSFQEFSQRYSAVDNDLCYREARLQDPDNRQNSIEILDQKLHDEWHEIQADVWEEAQRAYRWGLARGLAKEQIRAVLPEGNTATTLYMNGTIRSWLHYVDVRGGEDTQKEHREIALAVRSLLEKEKIYDTQHANNKRTG